MLEALLNHFRSYGMVDLEFIIVNSKLSHAQEKLHELEKRVSFSVYQETDEEEVWSLLEGGKDDMYVYDRCGRLTYYVPFPLSILNESPLVSNAILATYFRSPCGVTCDKNETLEIEDIVRNIQDDFENTTTVTEESAIYTTIEEDFLGNATKNDSSNTLFGIIDEEYEFSNQNSTNSVNFTNNELFTNNDIQHNHEENSTVNKATVYFNSLYRLFFNTGDHNDIHENSTKINIFNKTVSTEQTEAGMDNSTKPINHSHHHHDHKTSNETEVKTRKKSNRCVEADYAVCKNWSKRRLLNAQKCCSGVRSKGEIPDHISCQHFGKKRCKKIQSILKCCIKTEYTEATEPSPPTTEANAGTEAPDVVCCRIFNEEKTCRVSEVGVCEEGEFIEQKKTK